MRGLSATVQWGYHCAASLGAYTFTASDTGGEITAVVNAADDFKLSQPALKFCITRQNGRRWSWPVLSLQIADGALTATVGPQE